mmetsp:Transcript_11712/g.21347  ORF Transcript_11712/g.21347 Transcript_11712/m.21347 type:complete len:98 (+) Transcript_11712:1396-1689(+)
MMEEEAVAAKKNKRGPYANTKLARLTGTQRQERANKQKRESKSRKQGKDPARPSPRACCNLSGLTDEERKQRLNKQNADSKKALANEYAANVQKIIQ